MSVVPALNMAAFYLNFWQACNYIEATFKITFVIFLKWFKELDVTSVIIEGVTHVFCIVMFT